MDSVFDTSTKFKYILWLIDVLNEVERRRHDAPEQTQLVWNDAQYMEMIAAWLWLVSIPVFISSLSLILYSQSIDLVKHLVILILTLFDLHFLVLQLHMCQLELFQLYFEGLLELSVLAENVLILGWYRIGIVVFIRD